MTTIKAGDFPADPVAEELFLIRAAVERGAVKPATVRSLLAAVEAVLEAADGWNIQAVRIADEIDQVSPRNVGARVLLEVRSELRRICAETVREAISRALLGEGETDG
jgi:hypothetical protein